MRIKRIIASSLCGVLLILGGCIPLRTVSNEIKPLNEVTPDVAANVVVAEVLATFVSSDLKVTSSNHVGEDGLPHATAKASVTVKNTGTQKGLSKVALKMNGEIVKSRDVSLDAGASLVVTFEEEIDKAGTYKFSVDQLSADLTVVL